MKISQLEATGKFGQKTCIGSSDRVWSGCYIGDLLSWVMGHAKEGDIWVTMMGHPNIIAVAALLNIAAVIICDGAKLDAETAEKAEEEGVCILTSDLSAFECAKIIASFGC